MIKLYTHLILSRIRNFILFAGLMTLATTVSFGQTATLEHKTVYPGANTSVNLSVTSFNNVNAITFNIRYNPAVLSFISASGISPQLIGGSLVATAVDSTINIVWYSPTASTVNGVLCTLNFGYNGTSSVLGFLPGSTVTQGAATNLLVGYFNGSVTPAACLPAAPHAMLGNASGVAGSPITIPLNYANFPVAGSITQVIHYDATRLTFISGSKGGALAGATITGGNGVVNVFWTNTSGANINTSGSTFINLNFMVVMPGTSAVTFAPGCLITTPATANINVCYAGGVISQTPTSQTAVLGSLNSVVQGEFINIPLDLNLSSPVSSFTLYLTFNSPMIVYTGIEHVDPLSSLVLADVVGNTMTLVYTNPAASVITPGTFLRLKFKYNGIGTGYVNFTGGCQFTDNAFPLPQPLNVAYTNSSIAPGTYPPNATATIGSVAGTVGAFVDVPVSIDGGTSNPLGAATMFVGYNQAKLSFVSVVGNSHNANVYSSASQIAIAWADPAGAALNGTFLYLRFQYHGGGGSGCSSDVFFKNDDLTLQPCELATSLGQFVPANWVNGGVNLLPVPPAITGPANPTAFSVVNYFTDGGMINYNWQVSGGSVTSGQGSASVAITWNGAGPGSINLSYTTPGGCNLLNSKNVTIVNASALTDINGYVTYENVASQGMNGVNISLFNSVGVQVGAPVVTATNSGHGYYQFTGVPLDDYTMNVSLGAPWAGIAGVTALDALLVELHTAGVLNPLLTGLNLAAGNVNGVAPVNATDALLIKQRIIGAISAFPAGDWVFNNGIIHAFEAPFTTYDFEGLCTGDVNGSYNPVVGVKSGTSVIVSEDGTMAVKTNTSFTYNIKSVVAADLGAMTLFLGYDQDLVEIVGLNTNIEGLEYTNKNGRLSIAWSHISSRQLLADASVLSLQVKVKRDVTVPAQLFTVLPGSEFADSGTEVLSGFDLKMANIVTGSENFSIGNYPNPFRGSSNIVYSMPSAGQVQVIITDIVGTQVCTLVDENQKAGTHAVIFEPSRFNLTPGVYLCRIKINTESNDFSKTTKLIYTR